MREDRTRITGGILPELRAQPSTLRAPVGGVSPAGVFAAAHTVDRYGKLTPDLSPSARARAMQSSIARLKWNERHHVSRPMQRMLPWGGEIDSFTPSYPGMRRPPPIQRGHECITERCRSVREP